MAGPLSLDNPVFKTFLTHAVVVVGKTMLMTEYRHRPTTLQVFANPEDTRGFKDKEGGYLKPVLNDPAVERVRRCHLNDLENVIPFILIGLLYVTSSPELSTALLHFRIFTGARLFHTLAYLLPIRKECVQVNLFRMY